LTPAKPDIVIIQQYPMPYFGILSLNAHLERTGCRIEILIDALEKDLIQKLRFLSPSIIGFSVFSTEHSWLSETARRIHRAFPETPIIVGGVHAQVFPEEILTDTDARLACYGDGEAVLGRVIDEAKKQKPDWSSIPGIAHKTESGAIRKNPQAPLFQYREEILETRDIYFKRYPSLRRDAICYFISSRGCPFSCSFCYNSYLRDSIGKTGYLRRKSVGNFMREILAAIGEYASPSVFFIDDLFTFDKIWLKEFLAEYKKEVGIPFVCMTRAKILDRETAKILAQAGCYSASFGIETGNEALRRTVLNKPISNSEMIECGTVLKENGIIVRTSSMFCLPDETLDNALETVELNIQCKADLAASMLLIPYPGTAITDYIKKKGLIRKDYSIRDIPMLAYKTSALNLPEKRKIMNVHFLLYFFVRYPWTYKTFKWAVHLESLNSLFYLLFLLGYFIRNKHENRLHWGQVFIYAWRKRSLMTGGKG